MASQLQTSKICFVGGGNMAAAIIGGLLSKSIPAANITVAEPWDVNRAKMAALGVATTTSNADAARDADVVVLAVKPQVAKGVCQELAGSWQQRDATSSSSDKSNGEAKLPLAVSIAAGIGLESLKTWFGGGVSVVRVMPNTPALVGEGASGLYAEEEVGGEERALAEALVGSVSRATEWVAREDLLDVVTGLSGSGPAYFFALVEHLVASATALGLDAEQATRLAKQTCYGAGKMLVEAGADESPAQLRKNVTSPNGTTDAALKSFEAGGLAALVDGAVKAAVERAGEMGRTLGG